MTRGTGRVARVNVNPDGGVPKFAVGQALVTVTGVAGDRQLDPLHHGGPDRAVSLFSLELIEALRAEGHPIAPGTAGENLTVEGLDWSALADDDKLAVGEVVLQITRPAPPCRTIEASFTDGEFVRISHKKHPGWSRLYARVLNEGVVREGDPVRVLGPGA
jgi:MOSC domain-containing protein YiiM